MTEFIDKLGRDYFSSRMSGSYFLYNDMLMLFDSFTGEGARCLSMANPDAPSSMTIPEDYFTGFQFLKYPDLGYRTSKRTGLAFWATRSTTYQPGIRIDNLASQRTPFSEFVSSLDSSLRPKPHEAAEAVFLPSYHDKQDLERLFAGDMPAYVPSPAVCIEPSVRADAGYSVFFRNNMIGEVRDDGSVIASNSKNRSFIQEVIRT